MKRVIDIVTITHKIEGAVKESLVAKLKAKHFTKEKIDRIIESATYIETDYLKFIREARAHPVFLPINLDIKARNKLMKSYRTFLFTADSTGPAYNPNFEALVGSIYTAVDMMNKMRRILLQPKITIMGIDGGFFALLKAKSTGAVEFEKVNRLYMNDSLYFEKDERELAESHHPKKLRKNRFLFWGIPGMPKLPKKEPKLSKISNNFLLTMKQRMEKKQRCFFNHKLAISTEDFKANPLLKLLWPVGYYKVNDKKYVAAFEDYKDPIFGFLFHPEMMGFSSYKGYGKDFDALDKMNGKHFARLLNPLQRTEDPHEYKINTKELRKSGGYHTIDVKDVDRFEHVTLVSKSEHIKDFIVDN